MAETPEKKIIVDDDWKAQARAEKEKLAEQASAPGDAGGAGGREELPPADFAGLVNALVGNILYALGGFEDPQTRRRYIDLAAAKHYIDLLVILDQKTQGNLNEEEKKLLDAALYQVRMQYVQIAQRASQI